MRWLRIHSNAQAMLKKPARDLAKTPVAAPSVMSNFLGPRSPGGHWPKVREVARLRPVRTQKVQLLVLISVPHGASASSAEQVQLKTRLLVEAPEAKTSQGWLQDSLMLPFVCKMKVLVPVLSQLLGLRVERKLSNDLNHKLILVCTYVYVKVQEESRLAAVHRRQA